MQAPHSDFVIEICLTFRVVFRLTLRKTQGVMRLIAQPLKFDLTVPELSTLPRGSVGFMIQYRPRCFDGPTTPIVDPIGLKMHCGTGWNAKKQGAMKPQKHGANCTTPSIQTRVTPSDPN